MNSKLRAAREKGDACDWLKIKNPKAPAAMRFSMTRFEVQNGKWGASSFFL
jgi:hypothetical protein